MKILHGLRLHKHILFLVCLAGGEKRVDGEDYSIGEGGPCIP